MDNGSSRYLTCISFVLPAFCIERKRVWTMLKNSRIFKNFFYTKKMFALMWKNDKAYIIYMLSDILIYSCIPFINMYLIKISISMLETKAEIGLYVPVILGLLAANLAANCTHNFLNYKRDVHGSMISVILYKNIFVKTLDIDYERLLDKEIKERRELALGIINNSRFANLATSFHNIVSNIVILFGIVVILSQIDFWILMLVLLIVIINTLSIRYRQKYERSIHLDLTPAVRRNGYFMQIGSDFSFVKEIKTYLMDKQIIKRYIDLQNELRNGIDKSLSLSLAGYAIAYVMEAVLNGVVYVYLGYRVLVRYDLSIANFSLFLSAITNFNRSIQSIISAFVNISNDGQYLQDYFDFMDIQTVRDVEEASLPEISNHEMYSFTMENVSYRYPHKEDYALRNINLKIKAGEKLAIVGENGAGKSTLVLLLMRMIEPTEGRILLNGTDIRQYHIEEYRKLFSTVFQDFKLFSFTIQDNITSLEEPNLPLAVQVAENVGLEKKITSLRKGMDTYLDKLYDNEGVLLSGGEAQRLAIARALYKNAPIFVLDEPTAALDPKMEHEIYAKFREITEGKTTFYITHRMASTHFCDRIIVLKEGNIIETGSHKELIKEKGYYNELYQMQAQYYSETDEKE